MLVMLKAQIGAKIKCVQWRDLRWLTNTETFVSFSFGSRKFYKSTRQSGLSTSKWKTSISLRHNSTIIRGFSAESAKIMVSPQFGGIFVHIHFLCGFMSRQTLKWIMISIALDKFRSRLTNAEILFFPSHFWETVTCYFLNIYTKLSLCWSWALGCEILRPYQIDTKG